MKLRAADARLVATLERLAGEPEAVEWDLQADEMNLLSGKFPAEDDEPEPQPVLKIHELLAEARKLAAGTS